MRWKLPHQLSCGLWVFVSDDRTVLGATDNRIHFDCGTYIAVEGVSVIGVFCGSGGIIIADRAEVAIDALPEESHELSGSCVWWHGKKLSECGKSDVVFNDGTVIQAKRPGSGMPLRCTGKGVVGIRWPDKDDVTQLPLRGVAEELNSFSGDNWPFNRATWHDRQLVPA